MEVVMAVLRDSVLRGQCLCCDHGAALRAQLLLLFEGYMDARGGE